MPRNTHRFVGPLWVMWFGLLFGGMVLNAYEHIGSDGFLKATRLASSFALVLASWFWAASSTHAAASYPLIGLALGMTLGFLGDVSNAQVVITNGEQALMGGAIAFGIGHIAYIWACVRTKRDLFSTRSGVWWASILFWQLVGLVAWYLVVFPVEPKQPIHWIGLPYTLLLAGTAGVTCGLALLDRRFWLLAAGGVVFLASDLVLAIGAFRKDIDIHQVLLQWSGVTSTQGLSFVKQIARNCVWLLYGPAQMMIVYSAASFIAAYRARIEK